jgi:sensor histidine kinase regulating citrate/malate metabolism
MLTSEKAWKPFSFRWYLMVIVLITIMTSVAVMLYSAYRAYALGLDPCMVEQAIEGMRHATFNARAETVATKPMFRETFKSKRDRQIRQKHAEHRFQSSRWDGGRACADQSHRSAGRLDR